MATEDPLKIEEQKGLLSSNMSQPEIQSQPSQAAELTTQTTQDLAKGDLSVKDDGVYFTPAGSDSVAGQLSGLLSSNSPYIKAAEETAKRTSNARGLLNSTMAATAGQKAAIESALPIAQQDAQYRQQMGLQTQEGDIQSKLQKEQGEIQSGLYEKQGEISSSLSAQEHEQSMALKQADIEWNKIDLEARMQVEYDRMAEENKARFDETANAISDDYMADYMEIMLNPNFKAKEDRQWALDVLAENTRQRYAIAAEIAGIDLTWDIAQEQTQHAGYAGKPGGLPITGYTGSDYKDTTEDNLKEYLEKIKDKENYQVTT